VAAGDQALGDEGVDLDVNTSVRPIKSVVCQRCWNILQRVITIQIPGTVKSTLFTVLTSTVAPKEAMHRCTRCGSGFERVERQWLMHHDFLSFICMVIPANPEKKQESVTHTCNSHPSIVTLCVPLPALGPLVDSWGR
jgi:hypothetical protein